MKVYTRYLTSATDPARFPPAGVPEVAFLGRSNVGKSSLINSLLGEKMAKTSSTPGRTRAINFFEVRRPGKPNVDFLFVDLPGYGYARLPAEVTARWPEFIEPYLAGRECLCLAVVLIDASIPPQSSDREMVEWLQKMDRPYLVVGTKIDRLSGNRLHSAMQTLASQFPSSPILRFSARTGEGRAELWRRIRSAAGMDRDGVKSAD
jgi:GTP-binding protein